MEDRSLVVFRVANGFVAMPDRGLMTDRIDHDDTYVFNDFSDFAVHLESRLEGDVVEGEKSDGIVDLHFETT